MWAFVDYAAKVRPDVAVFESVQNAYTSVDGHALMVALRARLEATTGLSYTLHHVRHNAIALGGAAVRRRYFWLVSRVPFGVEQPVLSAYPTFGETIADLEPLAQTWQAQPYRSPASWWSAPRRSPSGSVDGHVGLDNPLTKRMRDLMLGVEWKPGMAIGEVARAYWTKHGKLPDSWRATEEKVVKNDFFMGFTTPVRWDGDRYGRVITGGGLHNVVHPRLDRTITHREAARILGFPDDWIILPLRGVSGLNMTWGKGITVDCGRWIGQWIHAALDGQPGGYAGQLVGDREFEIDFTNCYPKQ
jgi:site-specific DNA-cytosine methylase